jgi:hypothetical protein
MDAVLALYLVIHREMNTLIVGRAITGRSAFV